MESVLFQRLRSRGCSCLLRQMSLQTTEVTFYLPAMNWMITITLTILVIAPTILSATATHCSRSTSTATQRSDGKFIIQISM